MKFKVGDRVRGIGIEDDKNIDGKLGTVEDIRGSWYAVEFDEHIGGHNCGKNNIKYGYGCWCLENKLERVDCGKKIVITTDGKTTTAKMYNGKEFIKSAKVVCSPDDEFDFEEGVGIAISKLLDWKFVPAEKETFYNGKVVCIDNQYNTSVYTVGKIYEFKNGVITCDTGDTAFRPFHSFEEFAKTTFSKFIEVVE